MDKKTVKEMLDGAKEKDYIEIISKMTLQSPNTEKAVIDWCRKNNEKHKNKAAEVELENLWEEAREIISDFNAYGGGPEWKEDKACDNLWKMDGLVKENDILWDIRRTILDEMLAEFYEGNSGFDDILIEVGESLCKNKEEKRYLADALSKAGGYYGKYAADLYLQIGDEEQYLKKELDNLEYGSDYVRIAEYFKEKGDRPKALDYIWEGMEKCKGKLDELIDYAAPIYMKERNDAQLQRLYQIAVKTKWNINISAIAKHLYRYAWQLKDYEKKKEMLMLILDTCENGEVKNWFETCKKELTAEDWQKEYENILDKVNRKNHKLYLDICMETGREKIVLKDIQNAAHSYDYWDVDYNQHFSSRLAKKYPNEILELYWKDVNELIRVSNNNRYKTAAELLKQIKGIMRENGQKSQWVSLFEEFKDKNKRKKNFIAMLKGL